MPDPDEQFDDLPEADQGVDGDGVPSYSDPEIPIVPDITLDEQEEKIFQNMVALLGGSGVVVEIDRKEFKSCLGFAMMTISPYISEVRYMTKPFARQIDLSNDNVVEVLKVLEGEDVSTFRSIDDRFSDPMAMLPINLASTDLSQMAINTLVRSELENQRDLAHKFDPETKKLYLSQGYLAKSVTIEFYKKLDYPLITDELVISWINQFILSSMKEVIGRKRSKFTFSNLPLDSDGSKLLEEALSDKERLLGQLREMDFDDVYITR